MDEKLLRLKKLIEHWAEHNDEHGQRYSEAADEAEEMGLKKVAVELKKAHTEALKVSKHLRQALKEIEASK